MRRARLVSWVLIGLFVASACRKPVTYYQPPPIDGLRFAAEVEITGAAQESLLVRVTARNDARTERRLERGICHDQLALRLYPATRSFSRRGASIWDSVVWRRATNPNYGVCLAVLSTQRILPGGPVQVAVLALPIRAILGDTLVPGPYRLTARPDGNAWRAGEQDAGVVELRLPKE